MAGDNRLDRSEDDSRPTDHRLAELPELTRLIAGNETRLGVLLEIALGVGRVTPIAEHLGVERCDVSKHISKLFRNGLLQPNRDEPSAYELSPKVRVRVDSTGIDVIVTGKGLSLRVAVAIEED